jgi:tRNA(Ile)-lysidine synthase TilS/MesJ
MPFYRAKARKTVEEFKMFREDDTVGVAVSGGKDSAALLHVSVRLLRRGFAPPVEQFSAEFSRS